MSRSKGRPYDLELCDTIAEEGHDRLRPLSYPSTSVFVFCFSLGDRRSLRRLVDHWATEVEHFAPCTRWVVVGIWSFHFAKYGGNEEADVSPESVQRKLTLLERKNGKRVEYVACDAKDRESLQDAIDSVSNLPESVKSGNG